MDFFIDNQYQSKKYTGATLTVTVGVGVWWDIIFIGNTNQIVFNRIIRVRMEAWGWWWRRRVERFPLEQSNGVMTRRAPMVVSRSSLLCFISPPCSAVEMDHSLLCRGCEQRRSQATVPLCRPQSPCLTSAYSLVAHYYWVNSIYDGNLSFWLFKTHWKF